MYKIGDYIIYGNNGICLVEAIGPMDVSGISKDIIYYTLSPVYDQGGKIFTPIDNKKVVMRPIISREEALELVDKIYGVEAIWVAEDKNRDEVYKTAIRKGDCMELVKIIKTIYNRKQDRIDSGKKVLAGDEKYFHIAEDILYGELAVALDMDRDDVKDYIFQKIEAI